MFNLLILGNGFDINLGLKTSYSDFINSEEFENIKNSELKAFLLKQVELKDWIDVELELVNYSVILSNFSKSQNKSIKEIRQINEKFKLQYREIKQKLHSYLNSIVIDNVKKESIAFKLIEELINDDFKIVDFNFTSTTKKILSSFLGLPDSIINEKLIKIHGSLENNDIIFGVNEDSNIVNEHSFIKKSESDSYQLGDLLNFLKDAAKLQFFGTSIGDTDKVYFFNYFDSVASNPNPNKVKKIEFYHYGEESRDAIIQQLYKYTNNKVSNLRANFDLKFIDVKLLER